MLKNVWKKLAKCKHQHFSMAFSWQFVCVLCFWHVESTRLEVLMKLNYNGWREGSGSSIDFVMNFSIITLIACLSFVVGGYCISLAMIIVIGMIQHPRNSGYSCTFVIVWINPSIKGKLEWNNFTQAGKRGQILAFLGSAGVLVL